MVCAHARHSRCWLIRWRKWTGKNEVGSHEPLGGKGRTSVDRRQSEGNPFHSLLFSPLSKENHAQSNCEADSVITLRSLWFYYAVAESTDLCFVPYVVDLNKDIQTFRPLSKYKVLWISFTLRKRNWICTCKADPTHIASEGIHK